MSSSACSTISREGLTSQPFGYGTSGSDSLYACAFPSNYSLAAQCCDNAPTPFDDPCYSYCDLPASMNEDFSLRRVDYLGYFRSCLNSTGEQIEYLWCHATPHIIILPPSTTKPSRPTSTFDREKHCATADPLRTAMIVDPGPGCLVRANGLNAEAVNKCCQPAPSRYKDSKCFVYCRMPRGTEFMGRGDLTADEALGSYKACLLQEFNQSESVFDEMWCRNGSEPIDLRTANLSTTTYLTGSGSTNWKLGSSCGLLLISTAMMAALGFA